MKKVFKPLLVVVLLIVVALSSYLLGAKKSIALPKKQNIYVDFLMEEYSIIQENYWDKLSDAQLVDLYVLSNQKVTGQFVPSIPKNKKDLEKLFMQTLKKQSTEEKKKQYVTTLADIVLANLQPVGRSRLYSKIEEARLKNKVENKNPSVDQYKTLGISKTATQEQIQSAFAVKKENLENLNTPEAKTQLKDAQKAYDTLNSDASRTRYDTTGVESTVLSKIVGSSVLYMHLVRFSPTTLDDIVRVADIYKDQSNLDALIFDLRDNIGGLIDGLPYFLGPFIGPDQYAYQFMHQGKKQDFKTQTGWLETIQKYKTIVILINENSQSSAEVMAATFKKYHVGIVVGTPSKGWGTVEKVFPMTHQIDTKETFSVFMVHSLTLRDDGQPIEGKGVIPNVDITQSNWQSELLSYTHYPDLVSAVQSVW